MSFKIFSKYLGISRFSKDIRKDNLVIDNINSERWEYNIVYLGRNLHRSVGMYSENDDIIADKAEPIFKEICFSLGYALGDYPPALNIHDMYWYIAAYPDVINFFYPLLDMSIDEDKRIAALVKRVNESNAIIDEFEKTIVIDDTDTLGYFLALKEYYKRKNKLIMANR